MKDRIINTASTLYARYGIKGISMDQVAKSLNISKRTIYENFESKEELVLEVVKTSAEHLMKTINGVEKQSRSPLEHLILVSLNISNFLHAFCPAFYKNIVNYDDACKYLESKKVHFSEKCRTLFEEGKKSGVFLPDQNYDVISSIFLIQFENNYNYQPALTFTFLRGICTEKGIAELQQYSDIYHVANINQKIYS
ncbi:MAG: TetR/AcrR family transcriptional regulator [Bacteroidales bacterium]|nr:TetR/AcrR family transcriptional regulator [Bacteroidales bacterium]